MPLLRLETTVPVGDEKQQALMASLSKVVAGTIGKPEQYVMVTMSPASALMSGKGDASAFVEVRSIGGLSRDVNRQLAQKVSKVLNDALGIPPSRVYLNFEDVQAENWGWNNETFG